MNHAVDHQRTKDDHRYDRLIRSRLRVANVAAWLRASGIQIVWLVILIAGAAIPLSEALITSGWAWVSPTLGFIIVIAAGLERIFSRTTGAAVALDRLRRDLSRERRLLIARSGPYAELTDPFCTYAERAESVIAEYDQAMVSHHQQIVGNVPRTDV
jgi:hypothetical protein